MLYNFAIGAAISILLANNVLYIGFPAGIQGVTLLLLGVGVGVLFWLHGSSWEKAFMYCLMLMAIAVLGPGAFSLDAAIFDR